MQPSRQGRGIGEAPLHRASIPEGDPFVRKFKPVFPDGADQQVRLVGARPFDCGIAALHFEPRHDG